MTDGSTTTTAGLRRADLIALGLAAAVGLLATFSPGAATGVEPLDGLYRFVIAAAVTAAAAWASPVALVAASAVVYGAVAIDSGSAGIVVVALIAIGLSVLPSAAARAAAGATVAMMALNLPSFGFHGAPSLVAGVAFALILASGLIATGPVQRHRRAAFVTAAAVTALVALLSGVAVVSALSARGAFEEAIDTSRAGLEAIRSGDVDGGVTLLEQAAEDFRRGGDRADNLFARAARIVPIVSQHQKMLADASSAGAQLASIAAEEGAAADVDRLTVVGGAFDLAVLEDLSGAVDRSLVSVIEAQRVVSAADSGWLVPPLAERVDDLFAELTDARGDLELSRDVIDVAPWLLGEDQPRRYFVILASPAETRELGGFMGAYATLIVDDGAFRLETSGATRDLNRLIRADGATVALDDPESYPIRYRQGEPGRFWQNVPGTPDLPTVARAVANLYPQVPGGGPVDGVIYMDPFALGALVELSGPVPVERREQPLQPREVADYLLRDQYLEFPDVDERTDILDAILDATVGQLLGGSLPEPRRMFDVLQPVVRQNRLRVHVPDGATQDLFDRIGLGGAITVPDGDYLALRQSNGGGNKLDAYLTRDVTVDVVTDPRTGSVRTVLTAELTSTVPGDLPDYVDSNLRGLPEGTNRTLISLYSALTVDTILVDGVPTPFEPLVEYGLRRSSLLVDIPAGEIVTVEARLSGFVDPGAEYRLTIDHQPLAVDDTMTVLVRGAQGLDLDGPDAPLDIDRAVFVLDSAALITARLDG
ncbi:MAG: DUF4012 domain-containing protein [Acidimicrobiales bacterium]